MKKLLALGLLLALSGCTFNLVDDLTGSSKPLRESILSGDAEEKVAVIDINGTISDESVSSMLGAAPNMVELISAQLKLAKDDPAVRALVLKVNSPGGTVSASEMIYHEIMNFKIARPGVPVVVSMTALAASGGYYVSLPADSIFAMPSTITGSIGVIMMCPNVKGLMDMVGVKMAVYKSGENKDIVSLFKDPSASDSEIVQAMVMEGAEDFWALVLKHRQLTPKGVALMKTARVFSARQAQEIGLIDKIGFPEDAIACAQSLAKISPDARVVTYRRNYYPNDNLYNKRMQSDLNFNVQMIDLGTMGSALKWKPGMYMLWMPDPQF